MREAMTERELWFCSILKDDKKLMYTIDEEPTKSFDLFEKLY